MINPILSSNRQQCGNINYWIYCEHSQIFPFADLYAFPSNDTLSTPDKTRFEVYVNLIIIKLSPNIPPLMQSKTIVNTLMYSMHYVQTSSDEDIISEMIVEFMSLCSYK